VKRRLDLDETLSTGLLERQHVVSEPIAERNGNMFDSTGKLLLSSPLEARALEVDDRQFTCKTKSTVSRIPEYVITLDSGLAGLPRSRSNCEVGGVCHRRKRLGMNEGWRLCRFCHHWIKGGTIKMKSTLDFEP